MKVVSKIYFSALISGVLLLSIFISIPVSARGSASELVSIVTLSVTGHDRANAIAYSFDGQTMAVGGSAGVYLFDAETLANTGYIPTRTWARSLAFLPGSDTLAVGLFDNTIKFWQAGTGELLNSFEGHLDWVRSISLSADGTLLASVSDDDSVRVWDVATHAPLLTITENVTGGRAVALSPDGTLVAAALKDNTVRVWSTADGRLLHTFEGHTSWVRCLAFSPDGQMLASGSFDTTIHLWNITNGTLSKVLKGHTASVLALAFSPDGQKLASGSVDQSVRVWQVSDGTQMRALRGHSDFVYSVAFSPNGKKLVSGSGDNSVRVWNIEKILATKNNPELGGEPGHQNSGADCAMCHQVTSSDCRTCHHPGGASIPPRVVEVRCEVCHANGVSLKWCPVFPRSEEATTTIQAYNGPTLKAGVPINGWTIAVRLASPSNGETLYTKQAYVAPIVVTGKVYSAADMALGNVQVQLEVWSGETLINTLIGKARSDGDFSFNLILNAHGSLPISTKPSARDCNDCHDDFVSQGEIPAGDVRLLVTATTPEGDVATDERQVLVDISQPVSLPVEVTDADSGQPLVGLSVQAKAILYEWKAQYAKNLTQTNGQTSLTVDKLSKVATTYTFNIEPTVLNGVRYTGDAPVAVTLEPGQTTYAPVKLLAHTDGGSISGDLSGTSSTDLELLAFNLPYGPLYQTSLDAARHFNFGVLPVSKYAIVADTLALAQNGLAVEPQNVDLLEKPQASLSFVAQASPALLGDVQTDTNTPLPFAWLTVNAGAAAQPVSPVSGRFRLSDLSSTSFLLTASAPGYYSRSKWVNSLSEPASFQLKLKPDTQLIPWGDGKVVLPGETQATLREQKILLESGWLWGEGGPELLTIQLPVGQVEIRSGKFALERSADGTYWLYIYAGSATVTLGEKTPMTVAAGQMFAIVDAAEPMAMHDTVALYAHPLLAQLPVHSVIEPSITAKIEDWLSHAGIGAAQVITMLIYSLVILALVATPVLAVITTVQNRTKKSSNPGEN